MICENCSVDGLFDGAAEVGMAVGVAVIGAPVGALFVVSMSVSPLNTEGGTEGYIVGMNDGNRLGVMDGVDVGNELNHTSPLLFSCTLLLLLVLTVVWYRRNITTVPATAIPTTSTTIQQIPHFRMILLMRLLRSSRSDSSLESTRIIFKCESFLSFVSVIGSSCGGMVVVVVVVLW